MTVPSLTPSQGWCGTVPQRPGPEERGSACPICGLGAERPGLGASQAPHGCPIHRGVCVCVCGEGGLGLVALGCVRAPHSRLTGACVCPTRQVYKASGEEFLKIAGGE